jgi:molybdopterin converting factor small subunit
MEIEVLFWGKHGEGAMARTPVSLPDGTNVEKLLRYLGGIWGFDLYKEAAQDRSFFLAINGSYCDVGRNLNKKLKDGDSVAVLPIIAGG